MTPPPPGGGAELAFPLQRCCKKKKEVKYNRDFPSDLALVPVAAVRWSILMIFTVFDILARKSDDLPPDFGPKRGSVAAARVTFSKKCTYVCSGLAIFFFLQHLTARLHCRKKCL
jgi:hypothetical protein